MATKSKSKIRDRLEAEVLEESINFYRGWRQRTKNGILPIGIAAVGKTTMLHKFEVAGPNLFMDFNRTLATKVDKMRLRQEFIDNCPGIEYFKKIDVPGELPEQWAKAYFDNNPRVLVILVDDRPPAEHIPSIREFLSLIQNGPKFWQTAKSIVCFRWRNLSRVLFVINKADKLGKKSPSVLHKEYKSLLADIHSHFNASIQVFTVSLNPESAHLSDMLKATMDGLARK